MPPLRLAPGVLRWEEAGCVQGRERHWLTVLSDLDPAARSKMAYSEHRSLARVPPQPSRFQVKITLGLDLVVCF